MNDYLTLVERPSGHEGRCPLALWPGAGNCPLRGQPASQALAERGADRCPDRLWSCASLRRGGDGFRRIGSAPLRPHRSLLRRPWNEDRDALVSRITGRLGQLSYTKLTALFENAGSRLRPTSTNASAMGMRGDFHFHSEPGAPNVCGRMGPLGGMTWVGFPPSSFEGCSAMHVLADGRSVTARLPTGSRRSARVRPVSDKRPFWQAGKGRRKWRVRLASGMEV